MELVNKRDYKIVFLADMDESLANAIRRYLNHISVLAVDEIEISKNDSPLYDETIAHRVGLIPLKDNKKTSGKLKINSKKEGYVYSGEFTGDIKVVYDRIPLTVLNKGQEIEFTATVKPGKGIEHAKFSPGLMFYRRAYEIKPEKDSKEILNEFSSPGVFKLKDGKVLADEDFKYDMYEPFAEFYKKSGKEPFELIPMKELLIEIESFGQLDAEDIFKKAIDILKKDLSELSKKIEK